MYKIICIKDSDRIKKGEFYYIDSKSPIIVEGIETYFIYDLNKNPLYMFYETHYFEDALPIIREDKLNELGI